MCANHVETALCQWFLTYLESIDRRIVFGDEQFVASLHLSQGFCNIYTSESVLLQLLCNILDRQEVYWRSIKE